MKITEVGKYRVEELIGSGSYGKVYKGRDRITNEVVALKVIERKGKNKREFENLRQEIQILKKLNHPNIILLKDHVQTDSLMILIMQYAPKDLAGVLHESKKFKQDNIRKYASQIISALNYLNDNRIVHRDLKPQNILLNEEGVIKICDFGFARKMSAATVCLHSMKGTPLYIAPEIIEEKPYGPKIDVWSLGIILYELFTGFPPFFADSFQKLVIKIINDKILYPGNMSVEFRELVDGMLQKNPANRYDWADIQKHPFFAPPPEKIPEPPKLITHLLDIPGESDSLLNKFSVMVKSYKSIVVNNELNVATLKQHQKTLKQGGGKQLKTDMVFYHELVSLFMKASSSQSLVDSELLTIAFKVIILLINKIKVDEGQTDQDITKKRDLFVSVVKLIGVVQDDECLTQLFTLCCFLLKSSFNNNIKEVDADIALDLIESSSKLLNKPDIQLSILTPMFKTLGTLAVQIAITLRNSSQILKMVNENKLLTGVASKYLPQKQYSIVFECLEKFIHSTELSFYNSEISSIIKSLRIDAAAGLRAKTNELASVSNIYSKSQLLCFFRVLYGCVQASPEFCEAVALCPELKNLFESNKLYMSAINYAVVKSCQKQVLDLSQMYADMSFTIKDLYQLYQVALIYYGMKYGLVDSYPQKVQTLVKKLGQLLSQEGRLTDGIKELQGWIGDYYEYTVGDVVIHTIYGLNQLVKGNSLLTAIKEAEILQNTIKSTKQRVSLQPKSIFDYFQITNQEIEAFGIDQKTFQTLKSILLVVLSEQTAGRIKQSGQQQSTRIFHILFSTICKLITKDQNQLAQFFVQMQTANVHRIIFIDSLLTEKSLVYTLKVVTRILKKCDSSVLDYIAVQGLVKLKPFLTTRNKELLSRLLQLISTLARAKPDFYPKIESLGIVELLIKYLADEDIGIKAKTLNLIGNMAKHSNFFMNEFMKHSIVNGITGTLSKGNGGSSNQNIVFQAIFSIGNIAFFNEIPSQNINALIPYLYEALSMTAEAFLCNTIGCITHLVRHTSKHVRSLKQGKVIPRILQIVEESRSIAVQARAVNCLDKLTERSEMMKLYSGDEIKGVLVKVKPLSTEVKDRVQKINDKLK